MHFEKAAHIKYILELNTKTDSLEYWLTEHLRLSGLYWAITSLAILNETRLLDRSEVITYVKSCQNSDHGFGGHTGHDSHLLYTLSAIQILATVDAMDAIDREAIARYIASLQNSDGSFSGDIFGETDTRLLYCAISALSILKQLPLVNLDNAYSYISSCKNFDGGYGSSPGAESHSGLIFCCVGALAILDAFHGVKIADESLDVKNGRDALGFWLSERQLACGGFNGRPEKLEDVCYSWWVLSSLKILGRADWIAKEKLMSFILSCQDSEGGFGDRPGNRCDIFHTLFGIAALSMLGYEGCELQEVDPRYCMTRTTLQNLSL